MTTNDLDTGFLPDMDGDDFTFMAIIVYVICGALLWSSWIRELPVNHPLRLVDAGDKGFQPMVRGIMGAYKVMFYLTWPAWLILRYLVKLSGLAAKLEAKAAEMAEVVPENQRLDWDDLRK